MLVNLAKRTQVRLQAIHGGSKLGSFWCRGSQKVSHDSLVPCPVFTVPTSFDKHVKPIAAKTEYKYSVMTIPGELKSER